MTGFVTAGLGVAAGLGVTGRGALTLGRGVEGRLTLDELPKPEELLLLDELPKLEERLDELELLELEELLRRPASALPSSSSAVNRVTVRRDRVMSILEYEMRG